MPSIRNYFGFGFDFGLNSDFEGAGYESVGRVAVGFVPEYVATKASE